MIRVGAQTGPYRWLQHLGHGSTGEVWGAERGGREIAVKVFRGAGHRSTFEDAIRRETRIGSLIAGLRGVVAVQKVESLDGHLFLEMEWVHGPSLDQVLGGRLLAGLGPIPPSVAVEWAVQILDTLDAVARRVAPRRPLSFLHRDIKPGNLLLRPITGEACVTDFGVARAEAELGFETTATGIVKGSPRFLAPEAVRARVLDGRADQFAVAAVLYELLTGCPLYEAQDLPSILRLVVAADVATALEAVPGPPELTSVLRTMLSRDRDGRFPSAREAALALATIKLKGPVAREMLPQLLAYATDEDGAHPFDGPASQEDSGPFGSATLTQGDDEDTLIDHPDEETTLVSADGSMPPEATWEPTEGEGPVLPDYDADTEVMDISPFRKVLEADGEEGED
ncbi:MAG: serine/threonine protein kinase [Deltaproteobacteria bacterium]|nr:serine/threonine protein kinase [Deltaproteobacteria bacterium]